MRRVLTEIDTRHRPAADALRVRVPPSILLRADEVVE
jgi:hypothetical protein